MSSISNMVLSKISENNNEYRNYLKDLNEKIASLTNNFVGNLVTTSNYAVDFSNAISYADENLTQIICKTFESYVIKDLRSVEEVNEQFVDKINVKLEEVNISNKEDKDNFITNLGSLLNDKYIEIIKIKRKDFFNEGNSNTEINDTIKNYINVIIEGKNINYDIFSNNINLYKEELYVEIKNTFDNINNLYLTGFKNSILQELNTIFSDINLDVEKNNENKIEDKEEKKAENIEPLEKKDYNIILDVPPIHFENDEINKNMINNTDDTLTNVKDEVNEPTVLEVPPIDLVLPTFDNIKVEENKEKEEKIDKVDNSLKTKTYDVDEILKIAKSPILNINNDNNTNFELKESKISEPEIFDLEFNEEEIVSELINRLSDRLKKIKDRKTVYDEQLKNIEEDEKFVDGLIQSSSEKKKALDELEESLDALEKQLNERQTELENKINNIMPFANAVLQNQKES